MGFKWWGLGNNLKTMKATLTNEDLAELAYLFENLPRVANPTTDRIINIINSRIEHEEPDTTINSDKP